MDTPRSRRHSFTLRPRKSTRLKEEMMMTMKIAIIQRIQKMKRRKLCKRRSRILSKRRRLGRTLIGNQRTMMMNKAPKRRK